MTPAFTAHNIRLDDGSYTIGPTLPPMSDYPWLKGALRLLSATLPRPWTGLRLVDLGCLEGGYAVEFARAGFDVCGIEVRDSNIAACAYVKDRVNLPNLRFVKDNALNLEAHGPFDVTFCSGLLYHLDRPVDFIKTVGRATTRCAIFQTHFAPDHYPARQGAVGRLIHGRKGASRAFNLGELTVNEGRQGRWYHEFDAADARDDAKRLSSWDNPRSFWLTRPSLLQAISDAGFDLVLEQFDNLDPDILDSMTGGGYGRLFRSTFVGIRTGA